MVCKNIYLYTQLFLRRTGTDGVLFLTPLDSVTASGPRSFRDEVARQYGKVGLPNGPRGIALHRLYRL